jgi:putative ABC transport system ATP-binding protein
MQEDDVAVLASLLSKTYETKDVKVEVLKDVEFCIERGEFTVIGGASGSGKTTLLNIISGIDKPSDGTINVFGEDLGSKNEDFLANFRCNNIGFVFQSYNLVSTLTSAENVAFPMEWLRKSPEYIEDRVNDLLEVVGLKHRTQHFPFQLSGGEQQRVAFARALANDPPLLLVDEPTGNLDTKTSLKIIEILGRLKDAGKTVIVATHDERISKLAEQQFHLEEGKLVSLDE